MTTDELWAVRIDWPGVVGGVNRRGECDPSDGRSGLNISYLIGDSDERVAENRRRLLASLGASDWPVIRAHQVHESHVATITRETMARLDECPSGLSSPRTDGLVTQEREVMLNLAFADCVPVLLYCADPLTIGVIHAGWRGTAAGVAAEGVAAMARLGAAPSAMRALIGPCICGDCYEVGAEVVEAVAGLPGAGDVLAGGPPMHVDLAELNRHALIDAGIPPDGIQMSGICTYCGDVEMFSYRKSGGGQGLHGAFLGITSQ